MMVRVLLGLGGALLLAWLALIAALLVTRPNGDLLQQALRLLPDLLRLLRRLAGDRSLPRGVRVRLWLLLVYLAIPIDVIPDFIPVLGYADDAIIVTAVLRSVVRRAGLAALRRHWPGTDDGLAAVIRLCGLARQPDPSDAGLCPESSAITWSGTSERAPRVGRSGDPRPAKQR